MSHRYGRGYNHCDPVAREKTRYRILGPFAVNGMRVWRIHEIGRGGKTGPQVGPDHMSWDTAVDELRALVTGRRAFYFGHVGFGRIPCIRGRIIDFHTF